MKNKKFFAIITAAVVLAGSVFAVNEYNSTKIQAPELTTCVDGENGIEVAINENEVPLGNTKVSTKTSTKKSKKTVKLKKASKKTYSKTKSSSKTDTKNTSNSNESVQTVTKTDTTVLESFKKKSKNKTVLTTVKTTVTTTTTTVSAVSTASSTGTRVSTASASTDNGPVSINSMAAKADSSVLSAFNQLGFKVVINSGVNYSGMFDAKSQSITMKANNSVIYHELGHFVAFAAGNVDKQSEFAAIYNAEKGKYTESDKAYVTQNASEYFAQSYKNYVENPGALSSSRPQTFAFMQKSVAAITSSQISYIQSIYGAYWASRN